MTTERINQLISKYYEGETSREEEQELRDFFAGENVPEDLQSHADLFQYYDQREKAEPSKQDPLAKIDFEEEAPAEAEAATMQSIKSRVLFDPDPRSSGTQFTRWSLRIAAGFVLLLVGFAAGQFLDNEYASSQEVAQLQQEVQQMKSALMNTGNYQTASAGERLSAVNISNRLPADNQTLDEQITHILIYTMNNDKSVNVRMAAAEALFRFRQQPTIQKALVNSLNQQENPLMQITLIDMLVAVKAGGAINEMQKMLVDADTQEIVRERLEAGIAELKA